MGPPPIHGLKTLPDGTVIYKRVNARFSDFDAVIDGWFKAITRCCTAWGVRDAPYWHGERANVSLFAGGAWLAGGSAVEEYAVKRDSGNSGRCDLYVVIGNRHYAIEAKFAWVDRNSSFVSLDNALRSAKSVQSNARVLALKFFVPHYPSDAGIWDNHSIVRTVETLPNTDLIAACFPAKTPNYREASGKKMMYPGVIVVLTAVRGF
jgi:hypothetical protein